MLRFRTRKAQALLIYLAVTNRNWTRDALATLFWPETDDATARKNLRDILPPLRAQIGDYLLLDDEIIGLHPACSHKCDANAFSALLEQPLQSVDIKTLTATLALYRGEFLEGYATSRISADFEMWALREQERLHQLALMGFTTLCRRQQEAGLYEAALATNRQLLKLAPWDEAAHRQQMLLLAQNGQRAAALAHFDACRQMLADELDVEPDAETVALYAQIQAGAIPVVRAGDAAEPANSATAMQPMPGATPAAPINIPHNLLVPLAVFVGRQHELKVVTERLAASTCRLLTITGPGGMGKSSLALAFGRQCLAAGQSDFPDGIFWISLADVNAVLGEADGQGAANDAVMEEAILRVIAEELSKHPKVRLSSIQQLYAYLRPRRLLLILDNLEHLLTGTQALVTLLTQAPQVKILATSRARLNLRGEHLLPLAKLSLPPIADAATARAKRATPAHARADATDEPWQASEAIAMFLQRAQQLDPNFAVNAETIAPVVQICQLVEGLPLGIELATSMLPWLSCQELAAGLTESLDFLAADTRDLPHEQRTLQAVFERSWRLLAVDEQQLLARLAIFPGSFARDAAQQIAGASLPLLMRLVDQSLVNKQGESRYILHRTVQAFADQKLQQQPAQSIELMVNYAHFYLEYLADREGGLLGAGYGSAVEQIQAELDNIHAAWRRAVAQQMLSELGHCLNALLWFYEQQGFYLDVIDLVNQALQAFLPIYEVQPQKSATPIILLVGRLQTLRGLWHLRTGRMVQAHAAYEVSWSILQHANDPIAAACCLGFWGASLRAYDPHRSGALLTEALHMAQVSGVAWMQVMLYQLFGEASLYAGDFAEAEAKTATGHALAEQVNFARGLAVSHKIMGRIHLARGNYRQGEEHLRRSIEIARRHHITQYYLSSMIMLGEALRLQGRFAEAQACYGESRKLAEACGADVLVAPVLWEEGSLAEQCGNYAAAKACFTESLAIGIPNGWIHVLPTLGWALIGLGELEEAEAYFQQVLTNAERKGYLPICLDAQAGLAYLAALQNRTNQSGTACGESSAQTVTTFSDLYHHPSATQQTCDRIEALAAELGVPLGHVTASLATVSK
ncbi:MAG: BTAD domain-containing putative transcriptional regulator [Caldilineaceae bacterium]